MEELDHLDYRFFDVYCGSELDHLDYRFFDVYCGSELDQLDYRFFDVYCGSEKSGWYLQLYFVSVISQFVEYVLW